MHRIVHAVAREFQMPQRRFAMATVDWPAPWLGWWKGLAPLTLDFRELADRD